MRRELINLLDYVARLGNLIRSDLRRIGAEHQLHPVHLQALLYIASSNRYSNTPMALSEFLGLTKGTVSQSLMLLEKKGLIDRQPDDADKRLMRLQLTGEGYAFIDSIESMFEGVHASDALSNARIGEANGVLRELLRRTQFNAGNRTFGVCHSCRHILQEGPRTFRCGLTLERLSLSDIKKICREHEPVL
jgi:DNA-binding MarR family transcriptional regulator